MIFQEPKAVKNERKPREAPPVGTEERQHCHRTRNGRGIVARLMRRRNPLKGGE